MAVDSPVLVNDWWVYLRFSMGSTHLNPSDKQIHNATKIYNALIAQGYSSVAACGILGNMQTESGLSPGALDGHLSSLPNNGEHLADLTNQVMLSYASTSASGYGTGLIQWDSYTTTAPAGNVIASFAIRNNMEWYDGDCQLFRLQREFETDSQYHFWSASAYSPAITWAEFKNFSGTAAEAADIFRKCRERGGGGSGIQYRRDNAQYWLDYFGGVTPPTPVTGWIPGEQFAEIAYGYKDSGYTYQQYDCIGFVNLCWQHIDNPPKTESLTNGTNSIWRSSRTFPTTDPNGNNPTVELWWKGTLSECESYFGGIPSGILLFRCIPEGQPGYDTIPAQYRGDGIGNFTHVGIYVDPFGGSGAIMQSGGYGGTGVHLSGWRDNYWTHAAFPVYVGMNDVPPEPPEPDPDDILPLLLMWYTNQKGGVKRVSK